MCVFIDIRYLQLVIQLVWDGKPNIMVINGIYGITMYYYYIVTTKSEGYLYLLYLLFTYC